MTKSRYQVMDIWRKSVSLTKDDDGQINLCRFDKRSGQWRRLMYFATKEDFDDFMNWLDKVVPSDHQENTKG